MGCLKTMRVTREGREPSLPSCSRYHDCPHSADSHITWALYSALNHTIRYFILSIMNRRKAEQFRKAKNNYFQRGFEIGYKCDAKMLVLIERNGKFYRFTNSNKLLCLSRAEIEAKLVMSKTDADFNEPSVTKKRRQIKKEPSMTNQEPTKDEQSFIEEKTAPGPRALGIDIPAPPRLSFSFPVWRRV